MKPKILVEAEGARETFERWLARGSRIGVFSNHALDSATCGHKIFIPLSPMVVVKVGNTRAPDGPYGLGWRYLLDSVETDIDAFTFATGDDDVNPEGGTR